MTLIFCEGHAKGSDRMNFSEEEIEKARELKRLGFPKERGKQSPVWTPQRGHYLASRHCPTGCIEVASGVFLVIDPHAEQTAAVWLPTLEDCFEVARQTQISFSYVTDYLHRKRFADSAERIGVYQLFIEKLR